MSGTLSAMTMNNGLLKRLDNFLLSFSRTYLATVLLSIQFLLFYVDYITGPWVPFGVFYLLNLFFVVRYLGGRASYTFALLDAVGKTAIKIHTFPIEAIWWQLLWQFISTYSIYSLFCYLMTTQIKALLRVEDALDKLSKLNEAIVSNADSGIMVFRENGECIIANYAAAQILGCQLKQLHQMNYKNSDACLIPELQDAVRKTRNSGEEMKFTSKLTVAGGERWCVISIRQIRRAETSYLLMMLTDISAYKNAEDARRRADQEAAVALARVGVAERKLLSIAEETQQRIGRELHDDLGQHLMGVAFKSELLFQKLKDTKQEEMQDAAKITALVNEAMSRTRLLAHGLHLADLGEGGLSRMLERLADYVEAVYLVECDFVCQSVCVIDDPEVATNLFRIAQEAVTNAIKHGRARHVELRLSDASKGMALLEILDDGCGITDTGLTETPGLGLRSMRYRAEILGASLEVATRNVGGTGVVVRFPVEH